jgi:PIN domain nuclease of toxin-antitoxin system
MIILDTHIWVWWVHGEGSLTSTQAGMIAEHEADVIGICTISCWEIAKLVEYDRLILPCDVAAWFDLALTYPGVRLLGLTPEIALESTRLPGSFHRDPADQIIVATSRVHESALVTSDRKILDYAHVKTLA